MEKKYVIDGYCFQTASDYERAKKERETIAYLSANTDMTNMKEVYKVYKLAIAKKSFQTVFGWEYLQELRSRLIGSEIVSEEALEPVPVGRVATAVPVSVKKAEATAEKPEQMDSEESEKQIKRYQEAYQKAKAGSMIKNFLIFVLVVVIVAMLVITGKNQYSIFTYFTNYEESIRNDVVNEYEEWENTLNQKEKELQEKEEKLKEQEKSQKTE